MDPIKLVEPNTPDEIIAQTPVMPFGEVVSLNDLRQVFPGLDFDLVVVRRCESKG